MKKLLSLILTFALLFCAVHSASFSVCAASGSSAEKNYDILRSYISDNGEYDADYKGRALFLTVDAAENQTVTFGMVNMSGYIFFTASTYLWTDEVDIYACSTMECPRDSDALKTHYQVELITEDEELVCVDQVFTSETKTNKDPGWEPKISSVKYLDYDDAVPLLMALTSSLMLFLDEVFYEELGFGLRGLGFLRYDGHGEDVCIGYSNTHLGDTAVKNARQATCQQEGYTGDVCCTYCGEILQKGEPVAKLNDHVYSEVWSSNADTHWRICIYCGKIIDSAEHEYEDDVCTICKKGAIAAGDVNYDTKIDQNDLIRLKKYLAGQNVVATYGADCNNDKSINNLDLILLKKYFAGQSVVLGG